MALHPCSGFIDPFVGMLIRCTDHVTVGLDSVQKRVEVCEEEFLMTDYVTKERAFLFGPE